MPPEWVDYQHINDRHRYQELNDQNFCWICGKDKDDHWWPESPFKGLEQASDIVERLFNDLEQS